MGGWLARHPGSTEKRRVPASAPDGLMIEFGFWPPREALRLEAVIELRKPDTSLDPVKDQDAIMASAGLTFGLLSDMARFSVRGWDGDVPPVLEEVEIDGRKHVVLSAESLEILRLNRLLYVVALEALDMNLLSEAQKKMLAQRSASPSPNQNTPAPNAAAPPTPTKTEPSPSN